MNSTATLLKPSTSSVNPIPNGMRTVTPHIVCAGAAEAIEFYKRAFGATEIMRVPNETGKLIHASIQIGDSVVMLVDEFPQWGALGPKALKGSSVTLHLYVDNADAWAERAVNAGANLTMPVQEMFWGDRYGVLEDPFGHKWAVATHVRDVSPADLAKASRENCG